MIYLDTNIIINAIIPNDKKEESLKLFSTALQNNNLQTSIILMQEVSYVLARAKVNNKTISEIANLILALRRKDHITNNPKIYLKAIKFAEIVGFNNINDCIHIAIAEILAKEFFTYDKGFEKFKSLSKLKITIL